MQTVRRFQFATYYHGRPDGGDVFKEQGADEGDCIERAIRSVSEMLDDHIATGVMAADVDLVLYMDTENGGEIIVGHFVDGAWQDESYCEVCESMLVEPFDDEIGEPICSDCAAEWDSDYARSYGPRAEMARLKSSRNG